MPDHDPFLRALAELRVALDANAERAKRMKRRIAAIEKGRARGLSYREMVEREDDPLIVQLLTESDRALGDFGARVRRTEALMLHEEGMTMDRIAEKFGVTRQRVSGLLREARADPA